MNSLVLAFFLFDHFIREIELALLDSLLVLFDVVLERESWLTTEHFIGKEAVQVEIDGFVVALTFENFWYLIGLASADESLSVAFFEKTLLCKSEIR